jgi:hypothetical protein
MLKALVVIGLTCLGLPAMAVDDDFKSVDLDHFIDQEIGRVQAAKRKVITMAAPISFEARLKRHPEQRKVSYVYTAMEMGGLNPVPVVKHRMFVESTAGRIIPVYVDEASVGWINKGLKLEQQARFVGYHLYSYDKGPAILVTGYRQPETGKKVANSR